MISGYLRGNNGTQADGYLRPEKYPWRFDGFLMGNNGPQNDGYLRPRRWAFDVVAIGVDYLQSGRQASIEDPEPYDFGWLQALDALRALHFVFDGG